MLTTSRSRRNYMFLLARARIDCGGITAFTSTGVAEADESLAKRDTKKAREDIRIGTKKAQD